MKNLIFPILMLLINCSDTKSDPKGPFKTFENNWTEINTKDSIPELLTLAIKEVFNHDFKMANPNEDFHATDVIINDTIPTRQLRLLAKKNDLWRLTYIEGGFGKHYVFVEARISSDSIKYFRVSRTLLKLENNDSIDQYLLEKKLKPTEVKIVMN